MRSRRTANEHVAEVARRRLELLTAELAQVSRALPPSHPGDRSPDETASAEAVAGDRPTYDATAVTDSVPAAPTIARSGRHAQRSVGFAALVAGWVHDRMPPTLQGRVQLGSTHLTLVALLVAAALAVTTWWVVRVDGGGTVVPTAASPTSTGADPLIALPPAGATSPVAAPSPAASAVIVIDVAGKVRRPGIATLPAGSRVVDAIEAAGGTRKRVDMGSLNQARALVDGEQIVVGVPPPAGVAAPAASAPGAVVSGAPGPLVNLNSATQVELETLPGIGPVTAQAIMQWRTDNGTFTAVDELMEVPGIGEVTLSEMAPFVTI